MDNNIQEFLTLTPGYEIRIVALMKDENQKKLFRRTASLRWINCTSGYTKKLIRDQNFLLQFLRSHQYLIDNDLPPDEEKEGLASLRENEDS